MLDWPILLFRGCIMLKLASVGYAYAHIHGLEIFRSKGSPYYVFVHFRTPAEVLLDNRWIPSKDMCILFPPMVPHFYHSIGREYVNDWIHFYDPDDFIHQLQIPVGRLFLPGNTAYIKRAIQNLSEKLYPEAPWQKESTDAQLRGLLYRLAAEAFRHASVPVPNVHDRALTSVRSRLYGQPSPMITVADLANEAGLSISYFHALYKKQYGVSVGEDMIRGRLDRACFLLLNSNYPASEIAYMCGYVSNAHFNRQFKKNMGMTPGQYRKNNV